MCSVYPDTIIIIYTNKCNRYDTTWHLGATDRTFLIRSVKQCFLVWCYTTNRELRYAVQCIPAEVQLEQSGYWAQKGPLQTGHLASGVDPYAE